MKIAARGATVALFAVTLAVCALLAEAVVRLQTTRSLSHRGGREKHQFNIYRADSALSFALRPSWSGVHEKFDFRTPVHTDTEGFRIGEPPAATAAGGEVFRILVVGDSFAFGWGVEDSETFSAVLERRLARVHPVDVINAGVPGYSTDQYWILLRDRGFALHPDLILVVVCGNDVPELASNRHQLGDDRLPVRVQSLMRTITARGKMRFDNDRLLPVPSFRFAHDGWLVDHSHLYNLLRFHGMRLWIGALEARAQQQRSDGDLPAADQPIAALSPEAIERGLAGSEAFRLAYHRYLISAIEREARARGIPLRLLLIEGTADALRAECARSSCLDQADLFTFADRGLYFPIDRHWTAEGHRRVGETLADWIAGDPQLLAARAPATGAASR